jgi:hypothetical protein
MLRYECAEIRARSDSSTWQKTDLPDEIFTHVLTNFGVMVMPDASAALNGWQRSLDLWIVNLLTTCAVTECFRILKPGGACGITTWDTIGWIPDVRLALATISGAPPLPDDETIMGSMGDHKPWHQAGYVKQKLEDHGFGDVKVEVVPNASPIEDLTVFLEQLSGMVGHFTTKFWSEGDRARYGGEIKVALTKHMTEKYPDGQVFELTMIAIIASARKPPIYRE